MGVSYHSLVLLNDGTVKAFGRNLKGQIGIGTTSNNQSSPILIPGLTNVKQVVCGGSHSVAILNDGTVKVWGYNGCGQLGIGNTTDQYSPAILNIANVEQISCGSQYTLALLKDGTVMAWGDNAAGQLGIGNVTQQKSPVLISGLSNVKQVACGDDHSLALLKDGTVKAWGNNGYGQLGIGNTTQQNSPVIVTGLTNVKQVACGGTWYSLVLLNDGTVKAWGHNNYGQLGTSNTTDQSYPTSVMYNVKKIICGGYHSIAILNDNTAVSWGYNGYGQLGINNYTNQLYPVSVTGLTNIKQVACGYAHNIVILNDGTVKAWGDNGYSQLGISGSVIPTPTVVTDLINAKLLWDVSIEIITRYLALCLDDSAYAYSTSWTSVKSGWSALSEADKIAAFTNNGMNAVPSKDILLSLTNISNILAYTNDVSFSKKLTITGNKINNSIKLQLNSVDLITLNAGFYDPKQLELLKDSIPLGDSIIDVLCNDIKIGSFTVTKEENQRLSISRSFKDYDGGFQKENTIFSNKIAIRTSIDNAIPVTGRRSIRTSKYTTKISQK